jgi:hypothetical protein
MREPPWSHAACRIYLHILLFLASPLSRSCNCTFLYLPACHITPYRRYHSYTDTDTFLRQRPTPNVLPLKRLGNLTFQSYRTCFCYSNSVFSHSALSPITFRFALSIVSGLIPASTDHHTTSSPPQNPPADSFQHLDPKIQIAVLQREASSQTAQNGRIKGSTLLLLLPYSRSLFSPSLTPPLT